MSAQEKVGILIEVEGGKEALALMERLDSKIKQMNNRKTFNTLSGLEKSRAQLEAYTKELERLQKLQKTKLDAGLSTKSVDSAIQKTSQKIREMSSNMDEATNKARTFGQVFSQSSGKWISRLGQLGGGLQTLSNTITKLTSPLSRLFRGTVFSAGYKLLGLMQSGFSAATNRADIMSTYKPIMTALAGDVSDVTALNKQLEQSLDNLNEAVLGLPTGLDEIVDMHKQLTIATGDMTKAEQLAIASNNAYLAGGADDAIVTQGKRMLQTLATTGELTAKQWNSLRKAIPVTWNEMQQEIEGDLTKLSASEFMDLLIDKGINGKTKEVVNEMLHTYTAATANIENAFKRMGQNILSTLDEVLLATTGKDTIDYLIGLKDVIDEVSKSVQNWIKANPDVLINFINTLKGIDINAVVTGTLDGLKANLESILEVAQFLSKYLTKDGARFYTRLLWYNKILGLTGGLLRGLRTPLGWIIGLIGASAKTSGKVGIFGKIAQMFTGTKTAETIKQVKELPTAANTMKGVLNSLSGILKVAGTITIATGTGVIAFKGVKTMIKDLSEIIDLVGDMDWYKAAEVISGMAVFYAGFATLGGAVGKYAATASGYILAGEVLVGLMTTIASGVAALDMKLLKDAALNFSYIFEHLNTAVENMNNLKSVNLDRSKVHKIVEHLNDIYAELNQLSIRQSTQTYDGSMLSVYDVVKTIKNTFETLNGITDAVQKVPTTDAFFHKFVDARAIISMLTSWSISLTEELKKQGTDASKVFNGAKKFTENFKPLVDLFNYVKSLSDNIKDLPSEGSFNYSFGRASSIINQISHWYDTFAKNLPEGRSIGVGNIATDIFGQSGTLSENIKHISDIFSTIRNVTELVKDLPGEGSFNHNFGRMASIIYQISNWWNTLGKEFSKLGKTTGIGNSATDVFGQAKNFASDLEHLKDAFIEINSIIAEIKAMQTNVGDNTSLEGISTFIQNLGKAFNEQMIEGFDFESLSNDIESGVDSILTMLENKGSEFGAKGRLAGAKYHQGLASKIKSISVTSTVNITAKLGQLYGVATVAANVARQLADAVSGINVNANANVNVGSSTTSVRNNGSVPKGAGYVAKGGLIPRYYSNGGDVPRGTDTVKAWLTPGEYVQRRKAVRYFGTDFMDRVNNLDIEGAMKSLYNRFGSHISNSTRSVVNNYNTVNNNQKVTQNVNTNNPNFAFKRSSRFVGAI